MAFVSTGSQGTFGGLAQLAPAIGGIAALFGNKRDPYSDIPMLQDWVNRLTAAKTYSEASLDESSPYFKNISAVQEEKNRSDLIAAIKQMMIQNRRAKARGSVGFGVNPERADETRSSMIAQGFYTAQQRARDQARSILMSAAQAQQGLAGAYAAPSQIFASSADAQRGDRAGIYEGIGKVISGLPDIFSGKSGGSQPLMRGTYQEPAGQSSLAQMFGYNSSQNPNFDYRVNIR